MSSSQIAEAHHAQVETPADFNERDNKSPRAGELARWKAEIQRAEKHYRPYFERCDKITQRFRAEDKEQKQKGGVRRYNVLWSLVNTIQPNLYMKMPKPYVSRRYRDKDPIARAASMILERCLIYVNDSDEMHDAMSSAVDDHILYARGTIWTRYKPEFDLRESEQKTYLQPGQEAPKGAKIREDEQGQYYHEMERHFVYEECETDHTQVRNFLHAPSSSWKTIPWLSKRVLMTRTELVKRFGAKGKAIPLTYTSDGNMISKDAAPEETDGLFKCALVYEVWDKTTKKVYWLTLDSEGDFLDVKPDPLGLRNFWPCPKPLYGTLTNNSLTPVPDFKYFEDVANELDELTFRISLITEAIRVVGVYDESLGEMIKKMTSNTQENEMIGIANWSAFIEGGGMKGALQFMPLAELITVLEKLYQARQQLLAELYEITGISDIVRGASDPRETAAAQKIKGNYAGKRLQRRQRQVARFAREHLEIQAEIICKHYDPETIARISSADQFLTLEDGSFDQQTFEAAIALLRDNPLRHFRIKIDNETLADEELTADREQGMQFIQSLSGLLAQALPMAQQMPPLAKVIKEVVLFGVRMFPIGRSVESSIEQALEEMAANVPPPEQAAPTGKSPEELAIMKLEAEVKQQALGIEKQRLLLEEMKFKATHALEKEKLKSETKIRLLDQTRQAASKDAELAAKEREGERNRDENEKDRRLDTFNKSIDRAEARQQVDRDRADREAERADSREQSNLDRMERIGKAVRDSDDRDADRAVSDRNENRRLDLDEDTAAADVAQRTLDRESKVALTKEQLAAKAKSERSAAKKKAA